MGVLSSSPSDMDQCIEECLRCARACEECHTACLQEPDVEARVTCMQHLNDCAEICFQAVALMARDSQVPRISVTFVPPCVKLVLQNVINFRIHIVKSALIFVALVQRYADKWLHKITLKKKL